MFKRFLWVAGAVASVGMLIMTGVAYAVTLSQTNVTVGLGQSVTITSENGTSVYVESNSSNTTASITANGTQITVMGQTLGSASANICEVGTSSECTSLEVIVQAASVSTASSISFSQNNLSLSIGSNQSVTVSGGNGTYTVSSNSNTTVASTNLSSNTLTVSGVAAGGATITVCDTSNTNTCGTLSVTINSSNTSGLTFGQNNVSLANGSTQVVSVSGGSGTYHISSVSNGSVVSANVSNNGVFVDANAAGSATITVCDTSNTCGTLDVNVAAPTTNTNQAVIFSVPSPTLTVGQSLTVGLSGSNAPDYFVFYNANPNMVQASVVNNITLSLTGMSAGTDSLTICAAGGAGCDPLSVTVTGSASTSIPTPTSAATTAIPAATPTATNAVPASAPTLTPITQPATVVANATLLAEIQTLQTAVTQTLSQIQSIQTQLNQLEAQVNAGSGSGLGTNVSAGNTTNAPSGSTSFTELLTIGSQDAQVTVLQQRLTTLGFYSGPITGYYGTLTEQAVTNYQTAHGITETGYVGPSTRAALNAGN